MSPPIPPDPRPLPPERLVTYTHVIYGLHAFTVLTGLLSSAFIVTAFLTGWPSLLAVILNYLKRGEVRYTYLESHFRWQIRTFWYALGWAVLALLLTLTLVGIPMALVVVGLTGLWVFYRVARGWSRLLDQRSAPL